ncbi:hypothetical protein LB507_008639 [Fusarium sp. FIESC RH6]|nr:hypothetical protein LB507_008639 [Fusarium sp. FIESC RH6]
MKFIPVAIAFLSTLALAAPSAEGGLEKRQCTCKKVGDEWICTGKKCYDKVKRDDTPLEKRQCSCKKVAGEWICSGRKWKVFCLSNGDVERETNLLNSPRDMPEGTNLEKRQQCHCRKVGDEWICSGPKCISKRDVSYMEEVD